MNIVKNSSGWLLLTVMLLTGTTLNAQIAGAKTSTVKVYGNCGMCEKTIEKAAWEKGVSQADWNKDTKMAVLTFDPAKTSEEALLKKIAEVGYDSDNFRASNEVYDNLHACCHYDRPAPLKSSQGQMTKKRTGVKKAEECKPAGEGGK
ncbi:MAG: heavy-metal-associated domain-containing protein [Bacteroidota bacterium]|jgi:copper chaperone CopZ